MKFPFEKCENIKKQVQLALLIMVKTNWGFITERVILGKNPNFHIYKLIWMPKYISLWLKNPDQIHETLSVGVIQPRLDYDQI